MPRASWAPRTKRSRRFDGLRSFTSSARPASRTRSGTRAARSRAPSSIGWSCTRCSPSRCSGARRPSPRLNPVAAAHHEKADGSGYHRRLRAERPDPGGSHPGGHRHLRGAHDRTGRSSGVLRRHAATELRGLVSKGVLAQDATDAVLTAAGHRQQRPATRATTPRPASPLARSRCCTWPPGD